MKKRISFLSVAIIMAAVLISTNSPVEACSPVFRAPGTLFASSSAVFMGKVVAATTTLEKRTIDSTTSEYRVAKGIVMVEKYWKGDVGPEVNITSSAIAGYSCSPAFGIDVVGKSFVIYAEPVAGTPHTYVVSEGTIIPTSFDQAEIMALGAGKKPGEPTTQMPSVFIFNNNLTIGSKTNDVVELQNFLINKGLLIMPMGAAKGYFGGMTKSALARYQASVGIKPAIGYFGPVTRMKVNLGL